MKNPVSYPLQDRRNFALWAHAMTCFKNCSSACEAISQKNVTPFDFLYKPLTVWAVIVYMKPFTDSKLGKLPPEIIEGNEKLHKHIQNFRYKFVAHLDMQGLSEEVPFHHFVRIDFKDKGAEYIIEEPKIGPETLPDLGSLAKRLSEKCLFHLGKHLKKISQAVTKARTGKGEYLVDVNNESGGLQKLAGSEKATLFWN